MTAVELITRALRLAGVVGSGETPNADELTEGLDTLNEMIQGFQLERLMIYTTDRQQFNLVSGQQTYTIGQSANFNYQPRPIWISAATVIPVPAATNPVELPLTQLTLDQWAGVQDKSTQSTFPTQFYYDRGFAFGNISFWPVPSSSLPDVVLYVPQNLEDFSGSLYTDFQFPVGYAKMLRYNLAVEFFQEYGKPMDPAVYATAVETKANIKRANMTMDDLVVDDALRSNSSLFNYYTGEPFGGG